MDVQELRLAIIGMGKMGLLHNSLLNVIPGVQVIAVCEKSALMTKLFKKLFSGKGPTVLNNVDKLQGLNLDAVYITTPISSHSSIIKNVYSKAISKNIFVEKTLASKFPDSAELCEISKNIGGVTMVGYMKRFSVIFGKARELLSNGALGEPRRFKAYAYSSDFVGLTNESKSSASRGGALSDLGCHVIDLALWLFGPLRVCDVLSVKKDESNSETSVNFTASNSEELLGSFDVSQSMSNYRMPEFGLSIECSKGSLEVNDDRVLLKSNKGEVKKWYRHDLNDNVFFSMGEAEYFRENQNFVNSLLTNRRCEPSFDSASRVDFIIDEVRKKIALV